MNYTGQIINNNINLMQQIKLNTNMLPGTIDNPLINNESTSTKSNSPEGSSSIPVHDMDFNGKIKSNSIG